MVPKRSMKTTKRMLKQQNPQRSFSQTSSAKLWMVELIHRRLCDNRTLHVSGAAVIAYASGMNLYDMNGKCFVINVVRYLSSPSESRFFLCRVSTSQSLYSVITLSEMIKGRPLSAVRSRYMQKLPMSVQLPREFEDQPTIQANK